MDSKPSSRREILKGGVAVGAVAASAAVTTAPRALADAPTSYKLNEAPMIPSTEDLIKYGQRSHYVTSVRLQEPGRAVPAIYRDFGLTAHIFTPLQDSYGSIQANSLHYFATTKG